MRVPWASVDEERLASAANRASSGLGWVKRALTWHSLSTSMLLIGIIAGFAFLPGGKSKLSGAGLLLVGGAMIGVPHGMTDFVVAHRLLARRFAAWWLPSFVVAYLLVVASVLLGWALAPLATFAVFLAVSALHFGAVEEPASARRWPWLSFSARATTPLLPIFLLHAPTVAPYVEGMAGRSAAEVMATLEWLKPILIVPWGGLVAASVLTGAGRNAGSEAYIESVEIGALALAAIVLPPLVTFATYFCSIHAVRHVIGLTGHYHPREPVQACRLAVLVVAPAGLVCSVALAFFWSDAAGAAPTQALLSSALQLLAALTVPHMALEALARHNAEWFQKPVPLMRTLSQIEW